MRIANIAALILVTASFPAFAQRSGGHVERKPSPATSAVSSSSFPSGAQVAPHLQPAINPYRVNPGSMAPVAAPQTNAFQAAAPAAQPVAPQPAPTSTASVPAPIPQPAVSPVPSPEPMAAVNYAQGQLTVVSQSASLGTVLKLISAKTGAVIDLAPELQNERVIAQIGPSAVREVMTALLDSPKIDYIIMGSGNPSGGIQRILVRTRQSFGRNVISMSRPQPAPAEPAESRFANGAPVGGVAKPQTQLTQQQMMENWQKIREEKKLAEIEQQRQDRENEANHVEPPPQQPEAQAQPEPQPNNNADNPPLN